MAQARRLPRKESLEFAASVLIDSEVEVVWVDSTLHNEAMDLLCSQLDKTYLLCDAVSLVLMRQRGMVEALTTDRHFDQAGFKRLLPT